MQKLAKNKKIVPTMLPEGISSDNDKNGLIGYNGQLLIPFEYNELNTYSSNKVIILYNGNYDYYLKPLPRLR